MNTRAVLPRLILVLSLAGAIAWAFVNRDRLDPGSLQVQIQSLGFWAPVGFIALFALATLLFLPGAIFGLAGGALFGPFWGTAWNLIGATLGATLAFLAARYVASGWVARRASGRLKELIEGVEDKGWRFVAFVGKMKFHVLSFVPDVRWWWIEPTKAQFVRDLLMVQLDKLADQLPTVELPTQGSVALGGPAFDNVVTFQATPRPSYITIDMHFPATEWSPQIQNARYYYLGQGIYMFGDIP